MSRGDVKPSCVQYRRGAKPKPQTELFPEEATLWRRLSTWTQSDAGGAVHVRDHEAEQRASKKTITQNSRFEDWFWRWISRKEKAGMRSAKDYLSHGTGYLLPAFGRARMRDIRPKHVRRFVQELSERPGDKRQGLANRTIRNIYSTLRNCFADAERDEVIIRTPCLLRGKDLPSNTDADPEFRKKHLFTPSELHKILGAETSALYRTIYLFLIYTGARVGEVLALRWRHVDLLVTPLGSITFALSTRGGKTGRTKTETTRDVPIHPMLQVAIEVWKPKDAHPDDLVFPSPRTGAALYSTSVLHHLSDLLLALGLPPRRTHDFRRTFISLARNTRGVRKEIFERMTHARKVDVQNLYHEVPWVEMCEEMARFEIPED